MAQAGKQLVGKVSGKVLLSALLDIGSNENKRKFTKNPPDTSVPQSRLMFVYSS